MSNVRKKIQEEENQKNKIVSLETNDGKIFGDYQSLYHLDKKEVYYKFLNNLLYFYCLAEVEITKQGKISEETKNRMNLNLSVALFNCNNKEDLYNIIDVLSKASRLGKIGYEFYQENSSKLNIEYVNSLKKFKPKSNEKQETEKKQQKQINLDVEDFKRHYRFVLQEYEEFMDFRVKKSEDIENLLSSFLRMKNTIEDEIYMQLGREESEKYLADINKKRNSLYKLQDYISEIGDDSFGL